LYKKLSPLFLSLQDPEIGRLRKLKRKDFMRVWFDFRSDHIRHGLWIRKRCSFFSLRKRYQVTAVDKNINNESILDFTSKGILPYPGAIEDFLLKFPNIMVRNRNRYEGTGDTKNKGLKYWHVLEYVISV
jgi:hypothetical protein